MYIISIYEKMSAWEPEDQDILVLAIYTYFDTFAVVLSAPPQVSALALQREALRIREEITRIGESFPYRFYLGTGRVYEHISDLKYSYDDARRSLQRQMYHEGGSEAETRPEAEDETTRYMERRLEQITAEIDEANREESEVLIQRCLEEICQKIESAEQARELFEQLCNRLLEKMLSLHIPEGEVKNIYHRPIRRMLSEAETVEEMARETDRLCRQSLWVVEMYSRKSKYVYVEEAETYIRQHYKDCDLSQNEVAEHIGISPSYLSERFREVTGESFIACLNRYRVEQAKLLLATSSVSVGEIGFLCGFHSAQNFSRVFRKYTGTTPSQYRTRNQQS
ncbi:MAG: helix-turn-helix transcriptional regulator, partial [Lachnospiraceae bacterium]|nr:helix-turn-helix transcriptional regulator [Lachnospiraceae bacterium]